MSVSQDTSVPEDRPGCGDSGRSGKTKTPGVFKRIDGHGKIVGYVAVIRSRRQAAQAQRPHLRGGAADQARERNRP